MALSVPAKLRGLKGINAFSDAGSVRKATLHKDGKRFLKNLAEALGLVDYDIRSNMGGIAVSGEVTLHSETLYVQLYESAVGREGVQVLYRSCKSRKDYCGNQNNFAHIDDLAKDTARRESFVAHLTTLSAAEMLSRPQLQSLMAD